MAEKRKLETPEQANNRKKIAAEKMAEKRKLETPEQANNRKKKSAEKMAEIRKLETPEQANIRKRKIVAFHFRALMSAPFSINNRTNSISLFPV